MHQFLKTNYAQDVSLFGNRNAVVSYAVLIVVLLLVPAVLGEFYVGELGGVFIFAIAGVGLAGAALLAALAMPQLRRMRA